MSFPQKTDEPRPKSPSKGFFPDRGKSRSPTRPAAPPVQQQKKKNNDDDDDAGDSWEEWNSPAAARIAHPKPRVLDLPPRTLVLPSVSGASATATGATASASSAATGGGLNLRTAHALSERTQQMRERRADLLAHSPINRIVFLQRIVLFAATGIRRAAELSYVNATFSECIRNYCDSFLWAHLVTDPVVKHTDTIAQFDRKKTRLLQPPSLSSKSLGEKHLFRLCGSLACELPWLVDALLKPIDAGGGGVSPDVQNSEKWTPIDFSVAHGLNETTMTLLRHGAKVTRRALDAAARHRRVALFEMLLSRSHTSLQLFDEEDDKEHQERMAYLRSLGIISTGPAPNASLVFALGKSNLPSVLHRAAQQRGEEGPQMMELLRKHVSQKGFAELLVKQDHLGNNPLHQAALEDAVESVSWIQHYLLSVVDEKPLTDAVRLAKNHAKQTPLDILRSRATGRSEQ